VPALPFRERKGERRGTLPEERATINEAATESDVSFRVLSDVARLLVSESDLTRLLESIADAVAALIPYDGLVLYQADPVLRELRPMFARHPRADEIYRRAALPFGDGLTGFGAEHREAVMSNDGEGERQDALVDGHPSEESVMSVPLLARDELKGMLNLCRFGSDNWFVASDLDMAKRFAELAALALDNAHIRMKLESEIITDHLTGLHNHRYFQERLAEEVRRSGRSGSPVSVLLIDVDNFKRINEQDSPLEGDLVLSGLGTLLRVEARPEDVICRVGGDDFGVILPGTFAREAELMAERLRERVAEAAFNGLGTRITVSMGIAEAPTHTSVPGELMACANNALMQAKTAGKNRVESYVAGEWSGVRAVPEEKSRMAGQLKMLQGLAGKLNRLLDVRQIGEALISELHGLIDNDAVRVYLLDPDGVTLRPIAFRSTRDEYSGQTEEGLTIDVGDGITGRVAETGESIYAPDAQRCEFAEDIPGTPAVDESVLVVPLKFGARVIGTIAVTQLGLGRFDADDLRVMEALASHVAVAVENARLFDEERQSAETANALLRVSKALTRRSAVEDVVEELVGSCADLFEGGRISVWLRDKAGTFRCAAESGNSLEAAQRLFAVEIPTEVASRYLLSMDEPFFLPEGVVVDASAAFGFSAVDTGPTLVAPIRWDRDGLAAILITGRPGWRILGRHLRLAKGIADMSSLALGNAQRFADMEKAFMETVEVLANALEAKDSYTHGHARQVGRMALTVGTEMGMGEEEQHLLELAGVFHDIGKIGVSESIINKPGALDDDEWEQIRRHPDIGDQIMAPVAFLEPIRPLIRASHERWDGAGYPDGLAGEDIPLGARIVAVCDAWHAMTSDRAYRRALPAAEALRRIREAAGTQFDPGVVDAFLAAHGKGLISFEGHQHVERRRR
jgi:diguanylate cyclase (GGDEF)-like protein